MPELDAVTQTFYANVEPYIDGLQEMIDKAAEFAAANKAATDSLGSFGEMEAAATVAAESLIDAVAELRDVNASLMMQTQLLASMDDHLAAVQRDVADSSLDLMGQNLLLSQSFSRVSDEINNVTAAILVMTAAMGASKAASAGTGGGGGGGGMFAWVDTAMTFWNNWKNVIHWVVMGSLEILSTAVPAMLALGAAFIAMYPAAENLKDHFTNLIIASGGLSAAVGNMGGPMGFLAGNMQKLSQNVAPDVWMIFGSAISIASQHAGVFANVAQQASNVLGDFATKIVTDLQGQTGQILSKFFSNGVQYMTEWGQVLGNFGKDFMTIMHDMPGVGAVFLQVLDSITKAFGVLLNIPGAGWLIGVAAALSAVYRYATFAAGALMLMFRITGLQAVVTFIWEFIQAVQVAAAKDTIWGATMLVLSGELDSLAASLVATFGAFLPFAALLVGGALVAGLAIFINHIGQTTSAIDQMINSLEALPQTAQNLSESIVTMSQVMQTETSVANNATGAHQTTRKAVHEQAMAAREATAENANLSGAIVKQYNALKQLSSGLEALGYRDQQTTNDMTVLSIQVGIQDSKVEQLNSAWDAYLGMMVGGMSSLANFTTALGNMTTVTATTGIANLGRDTQTLTLSAQQFAAALQSGATDPTGAAAWQNFAQVMQSNLAPLSNWLQVAKTAGAITGGQFSRGIELAVAQMIPFTGTTGTAAAVLQSYLQRAGITGLTLAQLAQQYPDLNAAQNALNTLIAQGTVNMTNASAIAQNLSAIFNTQVTNAITSAALSASGFNTDVQNMIQAQETGARVGGLTWQQWAAQAQLAMNSALSTAQTDAAGITGAWNTVPTHVGTTYTVTGQVVGSVPLGTSIGNLQRLLNGQHGLTVGFQSGGMVGGPSGVDAVHAMLTAGEAVLNARAVSALGGPMGIHALNNQPSEAVLAGSSTGGGGGISLNNHITVELDGRQLTSAWRVTQLTYDRRNPGPSTALNRPGRPG